MDEITKTDFVFCLVVVIMWIVALTIIHKDIQNKTRENGSNN